MSVFTNPASSALEHAEAYVAAVLGLLGDEDALQVLRSMLEIVNRRVRQIPASAMLNPEEMTRLCAGHDLLHIRQIERIRRSFE